MPFKAAAFEDKVKFLTMLAPLRTLCHESVKRLAPCFLPVVSEELLVHLRSLLLLSKQDVGLPSV